MRALRSRSPMPALVVVDAVSGVMVQTEKVWEIAEELSLPRLVVLNRLDRERASLERSLASLRESCNRTVIPIQLPVGDEKAFKGVVDLVSKKAFIFKTDESGTFAEAPIPADMTAAVESAREALIEMVAENDEQLMEKFFEAGTLTDEELVAGLRTDNARRQGLPARLHLGDAEHRRASAARCDRGLSAVACRSALQRPREGRRRNDQGRRRQESGAAFVWKTIADPFAGPHHDVPRRVRRAQG